MFFIVYKQPLFLLLSTIVQSGFYLLNHLHRSIGSIVGQAGGKPSIIKAQMHFQSHLSLYYSVLEDSYFFLASATISAPSPESK